MAADVSSLVRMMNGYKDDQTVKESSGGSPSTALITRDLLGGGCRPLDSKELDLDLQVPAGWEKRLDLQSGKVYLQRCNSTNGSSSSSSSEHKQSTPTTVAKLQDLNLNLNLPPSPKDGPSLFQDTKSLDLKLVPASSTSPNYQSVCTLDKVKSALERAEKETVRKRSISITMSKSSLSPTNSSSSVKEAGVDHSEEKLRSSSSFAAGCPSCLLYVLLSTSNPKCPRCNTVVPLPVAAPSQVAAKKPRIDLNMLYE